MNDECYLEYCRALLADFSHTLVTRTRQLPEEHSLRELAEAFQSLEPSGDFYSLGQELVARLFDTHTDFAPTFPRELLWFFGGDCLHYMADEEIAQCQQLDELRLAAERRGDSFDWRESRAKLLNLQ
jgi:hypothetical protein